MTRHNVGCRQPETDSVISLHGIDRIDAVQRLPFLHLPFDAFISARRLGVREDEVTSARVCKISFLTPVLRCIAAHSLGLPPKQEALYLITPVRER